MDNYELGKSMAMKGAPHGMIVATLIKKNVHEIEANQIADRSIAITTSRRRLINLMTAMVGGCLVLIGYFVFSRMGLVHIPILIVAIGIMVFGVGVVSFFQRSRIQRKDRF